MGALSQTRKQMSAPYRQCSWRRGPRCCRRQWSVATRQAEEIIIITGNAFRVWGSQGVTSASPCQSCESDFNYDANMENQLELQTRKFVSHFANPQRANGRVQREQTPVCECSRVLLVQIESIVCANNKLV